MTLLENRVFTVFIELKRGHAELGWALTQRLVSSREKGEGDLDAQTPREETDGGRRPREDAAEVGVTQP